MFDFQKSNGKREKNNLQLSDQCDPSPRTNYIFFCYPGLAKG